MQRDRIRRHVATGVTSAFALAGQGLYAHALEIPSHVHLSADDRKALFGNGPADEVLLCGPKKQLSIAVVPRQTSRTLVQITITQARQLGIEGVRIFTGNWSDCRGCVLRGPHGQLTLENTVSASARHLHISDEQAHHYNIANGQLIYAQIASEQRTLTYGDVLVRAGKVKVELPQLHLDHDEATAAGLTSGQYVKLMKTL